MAFRLQFRRYRLPLRHPVRTAHEVWTERAGLLLRLEDEQGGVGWGEVAPIPAFGTETVDLAESACRELGEAPSAETLDAIPAGLGCVRQAVVAARQDLAAGRSAEPAPLSGHSTPYRAVAALLPAGKAGLTQIEPKAEIGFRVFKWKVGVEPVADELALLDDVCARLPSGAKLRLDANGAWNRRQAEQWLERCAERPVEFLEQPCFAPASAGEAACRRADDTLRGLAADYPTPIALDESLVGDGDVERWLGMGWPGWFVVKPTLLGDTRHALQRLEAVKANVVFSSALETVVGARAALRTAFAWTGESKALGFGVWPLFADARFDGPAAAPYIRREDLACLNPETVWSALS
ncbi:MAG TPA: o-succinylbenzoate synthase [Opitutaceae bacterium]|nr:o-succinylbenzoate synthase [Opitutaceae bacterium]